MLWYILFIKTITVGIMFSYYAYYQNSPTKRFTFLRMINPVILFSEVIFEIPVLYFALSMLQWVPRTEGVFFGVVFSFVMGIGVAFYTVTRSRKIVIFKREK